MKNIALLILMVALGAPAASFTEFYAQTTGNNLNSGHTPDNAANFTYAAGTFVRATGIFTTASENPVTDGVTNGAWASIYTTAGAGNATFIGLVTNVTANTIVVSLSAIGGATSTVDEGAGAATCKIGGAWAGPNTNGVANSAAGFPFNFIASSMTNLAGAAPCFNFKAGMYSTTNAIVLANSGPFLIQGYTSAVRDGGKATIDGTWAGTSFSLFTTTSLTAIEVCDFIFDHNGTASATASLVKITTRCIYRRCVARNAVRTGFFVGTGAQLIECEAYGCNTGNTADLGGFVDNGAVTYINCISHDQPTANGHGFYGASSSTYINCIAYRNGGNGFKVFGNAAPVLHGCISYSNTLSGVDFVHTTTPAFVIRNSLFFRNKLYGVNHSGAAASVGCLDNNIFGTGTQTNLSGNLAPNILTAAGSAVTTNNVILYEADLTPWVDPDMGNFTLKSSTPAKAAGVGSFTQVTVNSPTNTVSFPDIGPAQAASTNSAATSAGETSHTFAQ